MMSRAEYLASAIKNAVFYNEVLDECQELCELAGLEKEWSESDGETFEMVLYKAADKLGVRIS